MLIAETHAQSGEYLETLLSSFSHLLTNTELYFTYYILSWSVLMTKWVSSFISRWIPEVERVLIGWMQSHSHSHTAEPTQVDRASFLISLLPSNCDYFSNLFAILMAGPLTNTQVYKNSLVLGSVLAGLTCPACLTLDWAKVGRMFGGFSGDTEWIEYFWELFSGRNAQLLGLFQCSASWMIWFRGDKHKCLVNTVGDFGVMGINGCIESPFQ